jgi:hypothetical protein
MSFEEDFLKLKEENKKLKLLFSLLRVDIVKCELEKKEEITQGKLYCRIIAISEMFFCIEDSRKILFDFYSGLNEEFTNGEFDNHLLNQLDFTEEDYKSWKKGMIKKIEKLKKEELFEFNED